METFEAEAEVSSGLAGDGLPGAVAVEHRLVTGYLPGLLSGLVCAGANCEPEDDRDNGLLTAEEVSWLDLSGCDLVVLSACQAALGTTRAGEGMMSLRRAFHQAGARTVISSPWKVRDDSTRDLTFSFYDRLWTRGLSPHEALRGAQLELLEQNRERFGDAMPATWGAFVLSGDWRQQNRRSASEQRVRPVAEGRLTGLLAAAPGDGALVGDAHDLGLDRRARVGAVAVGLRRAPAAATPGVGARRDLGDVGLVRGAFVHERHDIPRPTTVVRIRDSGHIRARVHPGSMGAAILCDLCRPPASARGTVRQITRVRRADPAALLRRIPMRHHHRSATVLASMALALPSTAQEIDVPFEKHVLENGLEVVIHEDHSAPVVAVYVYYHVGSAREEPGRSGFAHLFEHMMFQGSQHVGDDQHFKLVQEAGGTLNGTTNRDRTNYYETLPANQLERALWLEADRMGFLLPAVTQEKLDNQREVVKNERRQNYEDRPYGREYGAWAAALYPSDHPYSWTTIGSHEDLTAASLEDVHAFFRRWYGPNNATLAIGGDVDPERALALVRRYFGSIPRGPEVAKPAPRPASLADDVRVVIEDNVKLPQASFAWHAVPMFDADEPALEMLARILSANKAAILDKALTIDRELASRVSASNTASELAGSFHVTLRAKPGVSLDELEVELRGLLSKLAEDGVDAEQLQRAKNRFEADVVRRLETVSARTSRLAHYNTFLGDPDFVVRDLERTLAVTPEDVERVLERYVLERPAVIVSTVPDGKLEMAASGRGTQALAQESKLDRSAVPEPGPEPGFQAPKVWHGELDNGVTLTGTPFTEVPLVQLDLYVPAGSAHESAEQLGISSMTAALLNEGTASLTTTELTEELDALGARLSVRSGEDEIVLSLNTLSKHLPRAVALLEDVILRPRFAQEDFDRLKNERLVSIEARADDISRTAARAFGRLLWGETVRGMPSEGTQATIEALTRDDVAAFWSRLGIPEGARMTIVGDLDAAKVEALFSDLIEAWRVDPSKPVAAAFKTEGDLAELQPSLYLVDKPNASQSQIRIGHRSVSSTDEDWYPLYVLNYVLGGSFSSRINLNLREDKGYTYGARSSFTGGLRPGAFVASTGVRRDVTKESVHEIMRELNLILEGVDEEELEFTRKALVQAMSRQYESTRALAGYLNNISKYGYPDDYLEERVTMLHELTPEKLKAMARKHLTPNEMVLLVVGDAEHVQAGLEELGYGPVQRVGIDGELLED